MGKNQRKPKLDQLSQSNETPVVTAKDGIKPSIDSSSTEKTSPDSPKSKKTSKKKLEFFDESVADNTGGDTKDSPKCDSKTPEKTSEDMTDNTSGAEEPTKKKSKKKNKKKDPKSDNEDNDEDIASDEDKGIKVLKIGLNMRAEIIKISGKPELKLLMSNEAQEIQTSDTVMAFNVQQWIAFKQLVPQIDDLMSDTKKPKIANIN